MKDVRISLLMISLENKTRNFSILKELNLKDSLRVPECFKSKKKISKLELHRKMIEKGIVF